MTTGTGQIVKSNAALRERKIKIRTFCSHHHALVFVFLVLRKVLQ